MGASAASRPVRPTQPESVQRRQVCSAKAGSQTTLFFDRALVCRNVPHLGSLGKCCVPCIQNSALRQRNPWPRPNSGGPGSCHLSRILSTGPSIVLPLPQGHSLKVPPPYCGPIVTHHRMPPNPPLFALPLRACFLRFPPFPCVSLTRFPVAVAAVPSAGAGGGGHAQKGVGCWTDPRDGAALVSDQTRRGRRRHQLRVFAHLAATSRGCCGVPRPLYPLEHPRRVYS